jgi:hypothetical protein
VFAKYPRVLVAIYNRIGIASNPPIVAGLAADYKLLVSAPDAAPVVGVSVI